MEKILINKKMCFVMIRFLYCDLLVLNWVRTRDAFLCPCYYEVNISVTLVHCTYGDHDSRENHILNIVLYRLVIITLLKKKEKKKTTTNETKPHVQRPQKTLIHRRSANRSLYSSTYTDQTEKSKIKPHSTNCIIIYK